VGAFGRARLLMAGDSRALIEMASRSESGKRYHVVIIGKSVSGRVDRESVLAEVVSLTHRAGYLHVSFGAWSSYGG